MIEPVLRDEAMTNEPIKCGSDPDQLFSLEFGVASLTLTTLSALLVFYVFDCFEWLFDL